MIVDFMDKHKQTEMTNNSKHPAKSVKLLVFLSAFSSQTINKKYKQEQQ